MLSIKTKGQEYISKDSLTAKKLETTPLKRIEFLDEYLNKAEALCEEIEEKSAEVNTLLSEIRGLTMNWLQADREDKVRDSDVNLSIEEIGEIIRRLNSHWNNSWDYKVQIENCKKYDLGGIDELRDKERTCMDLFRETKYLLESMGVKICPPDHFCGQWYRIYGKGGV